ncbi:MULTISPECIES: GNAT family N-acetyltransferase [unclassified Methanoculleus]|uniref:GNAT family N-acetyltransferase n=1 Tax=unclassified Methanoculleus TaxID=2619537 RepID=UPI0025E38A5E|nr:MULTISPECIES: GNAT family N-acetyltransferase [unclassified Methanoculleus]MCK9297346.1 GNAT family N-acetyltransferase [Methanoculleus sp.]MDD2254037.1 GNAT family N-acetyltransferase [Methanoculleus sp.]MDD2786595.1 GNAT family N-acetyltransferase [Methanoculleus sp.]MDD3216458.1 GNAT family N-acetyltransferase [Methanoculleus sp.]MDD4313346.1 GNAT family N-acetyltransferase [Methanoculleus sp.]
MQFEYTDSVSPGTWRSFLDGRENVYFFHTPEWAKIMKEAFNYRVATRLYHTPEGDILIPMMESRRFGFSFYQAVPHGYGGIFSSSDASDRLLLSVIASMAGGRHLSLDIALPPGATLQADGLPRIRKTLSQWNYTHIVRLRGPGGAVEEKYNRHVRRDIRVAERNHVETVQKDSLMQFRQYYALYERRAREWGHRIPPYSLDFYDLLHRYGRPYVQVRLAEMHGAVIGGLVTFEYMDTMFTWSNAAPEASRSFRPIHLLLHDALQSAQEKGYSLVNLGGSGNLQGVQKFKESFGATRVDLETYRIESRLALLAQIGRKPLTSTKQ